MSEYSSLLATINANVKANNNHEITGAIMNSVLNAMVASLGAGYQFVGMATPTNPGTAQTPDYKCFYLATTPGTYSNLGGLVVANGEVALLKWDSTWTKEVTGIATASNVDELSSSALEFAKSLSGEIVAGRRVENIVGKYLTNAEHPTLAEHPTALTSHPIVLKQGETIVLNTIADGITAIALTDEQASSYTRLVIAVVGVTRYQYTATEDCYVAVSGTNVLFGYSVFKGSPLEQELDALADAVQKRLSLPTNVYASQDGGNYIVNFDGESLSRVRPVSYTGTHFTTRIPLQKGKVYVFPKSVARAYNFALTNSNNQAVDYQYCGGTSTTDITMFGDQIHVSENELSFVCPEDNLYLWVNLYLPAFYLDVRDSFYLIESYPNLDESVENLDERVSILEAEYEQPYSNKVIYVLGDSITWLGGDNCDGTRPGYEHRGWTEYFKERIQPRIIKSYARSGATLSCYSDSQENPSAYYGSPAADNILWNQVIRMKNDILNGADVPDYIIISAGCNDAYMYETTRASFAERHAAISGLLSDNVENILNTNVGTSWYGTKTPAECASIAKTMRWMKDAFVSICPNAQVIICTPLQSHYSSLPTQDEVSQRIDECSQFVSWSTINQGKDCMISRLQEAKGYHFTADGTHTSVLGATMVGHILARRVLNILGV